LINCFLIYIKNILLKSSQVCIVKIDNDASPTRNIPRQKKHLAIITNETGIYNAFAFAKKVLAEDIIPFLSFIYVFPKQTDHVLFEQELGMLEKRFSGCLTIHRLFIDPQTYRDNPFIRNFIEAFINADISENIEYKIFGSQEFSNDVWDLLFYLGAKKTMIDRITN